jgi:hypothetical protein
VSVPVQLVEVFGPGVVAVAIVAREVGVTPGALALWWGSPHPELNYFSPRHALELFPDEATGLVVGIARREAQALKAMAAEPVPRGVGRPAHRRRLRGGPSTCRETTL